MKYIMTMQEKHTQSWLGLTQSKKKIAGNVHCSKIIPVSWNWDRWGLSTVPKYKENMFLYKFHKKLPLNAKKINSDHISYQIEMR